MRIYSNFKEAVREIERDLYEMGINSHAPTVQDLDVKNNPDYESKELIGYGYTVTGGFDSVVSDLVGYFFGADNEEYQKMSNYIEIEFQDRISHIPLNPGNSWKCRSDYWAQFLHNGKFAYTYSERLFDQIPKVIEELKIRKESRQCIATVYDKCLDIKNWGGIARIACSIYYHFLCRKINEVYCLLMIYGMRSCDFYTHFSIDVSLAVKLGLYVGDKIGIPFYSLTHFIDSLHAFRKDWGKRRIF
ncbi:MAG: thymidylate synthase [Roseiflexus sp.]|uniref:thymidylate synthase n=1 Tax=Roseiflexus sp. TaxID=2562120 RepID=UPI0025DE7D89|nr:thymidylate synthase [Roseiflexus sp.]MCL6542081.1 thymidylate synthase [Roseiflexus sp.]